jgi:uncharacterized protein involved in copper resistance
MQPEIELNLYSKADPARLVGAGFSDIDTGLRLRYEFSRKFAPYLGVVYEGKFGQTANFARAAGESPSELRFRSPVSRQFWRGSPRRGQMQGCALRRGPERHRRRRDASRSEPHRA